MPKSVFLVNGVHGMVNGVYGFVAGVDRQTAMQKLVASFSRESAILDGKQPQIAGLRRSRDRALL